MTDMENIRKQESTIYQLQKENDVLEKELSLIDSQCRSTSDKDKTTAKQNILELKNLQMEVDEMKIRLTRQKIDREKLLKRTFKERYGGKETFMKYTGEELLHHIESRIQNLNNKYQAISRSLQFADRTLFEKQNLFDDITNECREADFPTEADCLQQIRNLELQHCKVIKNIEECENAKKKLKSMREYYQKKQASRFWILADIKELLNKDEDGESEKCVEKESITEEGSLKPKEIELKRLKKELSKVEDATESCYLAEAESFIIQQNSVYEDLQELKKKAERHLQERKEEKREINYKMTLMKEAECAYPRNERSLSVAKSKLIEQEIRHDNARCELERTSFIYKKASEILINIIKKLKPKINKRNIESMTVSQLAFQLENILLKFPLKNFKQGLKIKNTS